MSAPHDSRGRLCGKTDAVLALYLDGDVGGGIGSAEDSGFELVCTDALASHLRDCPRCQVSLQRARRLDAVLAESAGRTIATAQSSGTVDRLLAVAALATIGADDAAVGVGPAPSDLGSPRRSFELAVVAPTVLLVAAATALLLLWTHPDHSSDPRPAPGRPQITPVVAEADPVAPPERSAAQSSKQPTDFLIAEDAALRLRERTAQRAAERAATASSQLDRFTELAARATDAGLSAAERAAAIGLLLENSRPSATDGGLWLTQLVDTLATGRGQPELLADLLAGAGAEPHFTGYLRATVRRLDSARTVPGRAELAALTVAARLGTPELDGEVRRAVRRHHQLLEVVAAALRLPFRSHGTTALLLACWSDADRRLELDDSAMALQLFAGQPRQAFDELVEELGAARSVPRRVQCLLALASCPDRQNAAALLDWTTASCRREAYVAAWSLSHLPHAWLDEAAERALRDPGAFVLRAALARAGLPAAAAWTEPLRLSPREREVLATATLAVFPQLAEWFRANHRARSPIIDD